MSDLDKALKEARAIIATPSFGESSKTVATALLALAVRDRIFVLTVLWLDEKGADRRSRTWGWFPTLELAEESIRANHGDMYEDGYYNTVVLEEMPWGPLAIAESEHWYRVIPHQSDSHIDRYDIEKMAKPASLVGVVSFGIG